MLIHVLGLPTANRRCILIHVNVELQGMWYRPPSAFLPGLCHETVATPPSCANRIARRSLAAIMAIFGLLARVPPGSTFITSHGTNIWICACHRCDTLDVSGAGVRLHAWEKGDQVTWLLLTSKLSGGR